MRPEGGTSGLRASLQRLGEIVLGGTDTDDRIRAGRLAAILYFSAVVDYAVTAPFLPSSTNQPVLGTVAGVALLSAIGWLVAPWDRWPAAATRIPTLWGFALISGIGAGAGALEHYLAFYPLAFLYVGLTQPVGTATRLTVPAFASAAIAFVGHEPTRTGVDIVPSILVGVVVGELLAIVLYRQRRGHERLQAILDAADTLTAAPDERAAADMVARLAARVLDAHGALVLATDEPGSRLYVARGQHGLSEPTAALVVDADELTPDHDSPPDAIRWYADVRRTPGVDRNVVARLRARSLLVVPIPGEGGLLGAVVAGWRTTRRELDDAGLRATDALARQAGAVLERLRSTDRLAHEARTDALTGLANRRVFLDALTHLRPGGSVVFIDLDRFKQINDEAGHAAGDAILRDFAAALRRCVRDGDCAARYGGEEFAIVLQSGATDTAEAIVQRLRDRWHKVSESTFSAGIAMHHPHETPAETLARADAALYAAKQAGRNCYVNADASLPSQRMHSDEDPTAVKT